jgi:hypothetical protein
MLLLLLLRLDRRERLLPVAPQHPSDHLAGCAPFSAGGYAGLRDMRRSSVLFQRSCERAVLQLKSE